MKFGLEENIIEKIVEVFENQPKVDTAFIFGSRAKGNYRRDSDIDIAIKGYDINIEDILKISVAIEKKKIGYEVDLVDFDSIKEDALREHVDRVGVEFYSNWKDCRLGDSVNIINGYAFKSSDFFDTQVAGSLPVIKIKNVANGDVHLNDCQYHLDDKYLDKYVIKRDDILIALTGNHPEAGTQVVGEVSRYKHDEHSLLNQRVAKLIARDNLNSDYLYYFLKDDKTHHYLASQSAGSANQANISKTDVENIHLFLPTIREQTNIAGALKSLDDKIDLLQGQNKSLESISEALFSQWFVQEANEDWEEDKLEKYILFDPKEKIDRNREIQFFEMKCLSNTDMNISPGIRRTLSSGSAFRNNDTLLAKITPCLENGKTGFVMQLSEGEVARGSTEFIVMRSKGAVSPYWIYCFARSNDFRDNAILSMTGTSGRQRVQLDLLKSIKVKLDLNIMNEFHETVSSFFGKIKSNQQQINTLVNIRNMLIPKLMSGEVRIKMS